MSTDNGSSDGEAGNRSDGGYVHRPDDSQPSAENQDGMGRFGWFLTGAVVVSFLVIPGYIYLFPASPSRLGLPFFSTFILLPLIPAILLGAIAVWSAISTGKYGRDN